MAITTVLLNLCTAFRGPSNSAPCSIFDTDLPTELGKRFPEVVMGKGHRSRHSRDDSDRPEDGPSSTSSRRSARPTNQVDRRSKLQTVTSHIGAFLGNSWEPLEAKANNLGNIAKAAGVIYGAHLLCKENRGKRAHRKALEEWELKLKDLEVESQVSKDHLRTSPHLADSRV